MKQLNNSTLSSISGGIAECRKIPSPVLASIAQVSSRVLDTTPSKDEYGDISPYCNQHIHQPVAPKNGDQNALGQQYSWGTWWDDMH